jgi:hypothetical protein
MKKLYTLYFLFALSSCANEQQLSKNYSYNQESLNRSQQSDTIFITEPCALFYFPDSLQIDSIKTKIGEDNYNSILEDNNFYNQEIIIKLQKKGIKTISSNRKFITCDNGKITINRYNLKDKWGVIFFKFNIAPYIITDEDDVNKIIESYFNGQ